MFKRISGSPRLSWFPKKASTAFNVGDLVYPDGSGAIQPADATSGEHLGVILKKVVSTDSDYASTTMVPVDVAGPDDIFEADAAGLTAAKVGTYMDLTDAATVNGAATAKNVVLMVGYISATKGLFVVSATAYSKYVATT